MKHWELFLFFSSVYHLSESTFLLTSFLYFYLVNMIFANSCLTFFLKSHNFVVSTGSVLAELLVLLLNKYFSNSGADQSLISGWVHSGGSTVLSPQAKTREGGVRASGPGPDLRPPQSRSADSSCLCPGRTLDQEPANTPAQHHRGHMGSPWHQQPSLTLELT